MPGFRVSFGDETQFTADAHVLDLMREGRAQRTAQEQFIVLEMLADEGRALALPDGFVVAAEDVARLDADEARILGLPGPFGGELLTTVQKWTSSPDFRIDVAVRTGRYAQPYERRGPVLEVDGTPYRLTVPQLRTLQALERHAALPPAQRTETANVRLVAELQAARRLAASADDDRSRDPSFRLDLGALEKFSTSVPTRVGLTVERQQDGSLTVEPDLGPDVARDLVRTRWHQVDRYRRAAFEHAHDPGAEREAGVLRVEDTIVLLEPETLEGVQEVRRRPHIPAEQAHDFLRAPGSFYDPDLVDVDVRFGVRVAGVGIIAPVTFTEAAETGLEWFADVSSVAAPEALVGVATTVAEHDEVDAQIRESWERGEDVVSVGEQVVDVADRSRVEEVLKADRERLELLEHSMPSDERPADEEGDGTKVTVGLHIHEAGDLSDRLRTAAAAARPRATVDYDSLHRQPLAHQREGIEWMTGLMQAALAADPTDPARIQGALLADDMGLGKTFMTLAALREAIEQQRRDGTAPLPTLAVMPVALLENWLEEIDKTFGARPGPFDDVVVLQGRGLAEYRRKGMGRETAADVEDLDERGMVREDRLDTSLRVGPSFGDARLDRPGVLVLTTYDTLRAYQLSLSAVEWGVVVMDEAQNTKNPEILVTRAAKGLQARFKLLATGTPVENSLRDFWCLLDTAQPGLLGPWATFRETWAAPMEEATGDDHVRLGRELRSLVGQFMLRRVKEDHLTDLPPKLVHPYREYMPTVQREAYEEVLARHRARRGVRGAGLKTLHELSAVSLHPALLSGGVPGEADAIDHSARTLVTVRRILDGVRSKDEKAIVFARTKELQRALALWLASVYGLRVSVVNGDTAATGRGDTRLARIREFEARPGFNVIVMSPLAVGVGLTVVGANHAIHLERHWNPAKEAQATDRIYRIGQTREVHVHYPMALHPDLTSFDENLDRLLSDKVALKDAVVVPREVTQGELEEALGMR